MTDAVLAPDPPDKPPARTYVDAVLDHGHLYLVDPGNEQAGYLIAEQTVALEDCR